MEIEQKLKELGFEYLKINPYTGESSWILHCGNNYEEGYALYFIYEVNKNLLTYYGGERSFIQKQLTSTEFLEKFVEVLK